ncbi:dihydroxyacetone kinase family protein [Helcobacillus massiliensis]|uniref:dihydroxyacetone kinase family protein n=1 Tax=Helcobacillus massiliensis TaxID=521392 RepID=UPI0025542C3A|nr:dihydroxyacetone kinase family protein [Helcobacillus massiliensis]MDK7742640.1 dihydroxyacetone kinase family protein [Helcobacillus massiliensis]WOO92578.1 dihydroxyacetone kinase family protein [Helcobacillus massiliensis]
MTYVVQEPKEFPLDAVTGLVAAHPAELLQVHGGVVRRHQTPKGQPALVIGGGSGHYPAFAGWVGPGLGHGAPCGNIFASPSSEQVFSVAKNAENGGGVILGFGNYAGDVLHFGVAAEQLRAEGIDVRIVKVSDDIASNSPENHRDRRGIAGDLVVFKAVGAAIQRGADIDEAERIATKANDATRSLGVAFDGCTLPGAADALFHVPEGRMAIGLGIHGEPGIDEIERPDAKTLARILVDGATKEMPEGGDGRKRVAVLLNGLGRVKYEELFVLWRFVSELLAERGFDVVRPEVGEHVTSLDMAGLSLTLMHLDDELEQLWLDPVDTPALRRGGAVEGPLGEAREEVFQVGEQVIPEASEDSRASAGRVVDVLDALQDLLEDKEEELGRMDAIAGDGDHGSGMVIGIRAAAAGARRAREQGAGARTVLVQAGARWSADGGGTSGALWGAFLTAAGRRFSDTEPITDELIAPALLAGVTAVRELGGAEPGDKTMVDAMVPFASALEAKPTPAGAAITAAAEDAASAAEATASITASLGRARFLNERSIGTPDPGAVSFSMMAALLGSLLSSN